MRSLYWKIFVFFWVTLIITMAAVVTLTGTIIENRQHLESHQIIELAMELTDAYEQEGRKKLANELRKIEEQHGIKAFILDQYNRPISRVNLPKDWLKFTEPLTPKRFIERTNRGLRAYQISSSSGTRYTFVAYVFRKRAYQYWFPHLPALQLITALIIVASFTAFVTWRITNPINRLRRATNAFARGQFDTRVDEKVICRKDEISQLGQSFNNMAERIAMLLNNQQRLFRDISHELRTPLARQQIALELLARKLSKKDQAGIERIEREIGRMNELIDHVLTLLRLEQGDGSPASSQYDIGELISDVAHDASFEAQADDKIKLVLPTACYLTGQPGLTSRALENIIRNALRYTGDKGKVYINASLGKECLNISIADDGPGVPEETLKHLFEPFYRVEESRNQQAGGYGIGMAIAEQAMRSQGGSIHAVNRPTGGLEVIICLPL
ncbi:MAG: HAMP domain-containing protein [Gammaproteobacteria bacterium]|jgi:signal transduction histidine kinase|nr:HAMP domain-containing protein [Gammaproteobacteria bacterium]MCP4881552.1 HAMP domain-containing protein [Gammaproteobacteria bacterium]MDP6165998.1 ATP-binding protein [Gammaproteobacteria bacterium]